MLSLIKHKKMEVYKHKLNGNYYRLTKLGKANINTYLQVDVDNEPIIKKQSWSVHHQEVIAIMIGFDKLTKT